MKGKTIGLLKEGFEGVERDYALIVRKAAERLRETGATVKDVSVPLHKDGSFHSQFLSHCMSLYSDHWVSYIHVCFKNFMKHFPYRHDRKAQPNSNSFATSMSNICNVSNRTDQHNIVV